MLRNLLGSKAFPNPKDHEILARLIRYVTSDDKEAVILDSFAGSGSTGHAVLDLNRSDSGKRRFVLVEMDEDIATDITAVRLTRVIQQAPAKKASGPEAQRAGFRYCTLGEPLFDGEGDIGPTVTFSDLAAHIFFCETGSPIPKRATGKSPFLGEHQGRAVFLLFSAGSLGVASGDNVLTATALRKLDLPDGFNGTRVVYADGCTVPRDRLARAGVVFKQVPYQIEGV